VGGSKGKDNWTVKTKKNSYWGRLPGWKNSFGSRLAWVFILVITLVAILGPFIANEKPWYCRLDGKSYFPVISGIEESTLSSNHPSHSPVSWYNTKFESIWYAPVPYSYYTIDSKAGSLLSPLDGEDQRVRFKHWLGTDLAARDVLSGMIRGCRISLLIGLGSMLLALLIGVPLGSLAAYWGNKDWKVSWFQIIAAFIFIMIVIYVWWMPVSFIVKAITLLVLIAISLALNHFTAMMKPGKIQVPVDQLVMSVISIIDSFPGLFIILILLVIIPAKGWVIVMSVIALLRWPVIARYMRAEVFKIKESNYIKAVQVLNLPHSYIIRQHIVPYAFRPVMISFIFGIASAILAESSLSFLGIGLPAEELNWGRLLSQARNHFDAWWLVLFPGAAIFFTLLSLYTIGNALQKKVETR